MILEARALNVREEKYKYGMGKGQKEPYIVLDQNLKHQWNSLVVQWLGLGTFTAGGLCSIPGWGTKIPQAVWHGKKKVSV